MSLLVMAQSSYCCVVLGRHSSESRAGCSPNYFLMHDYYWLLVRSAPCCCAGRLGGIWMLQVDLTVSGHHHSYQRTCPAAKSSCHQAADGSRHTATGSRRLGSASGGLHATSSSSSSSSSRRVYHSPGAPVHVVTGNAGAELSLNVEQQPAQIWEVRWASSAWLSVVCRSTGVSGALVG